MIEVDTSRETHRWRCDCCKKTAAVWSREGLSTKCKYCSMVFFVSWQEIFSQYLRYYPADAQLVGKA